MSSPLLNQVGELCSGLYYLSESDYPILPIELDPAIQASSLSPEDVLRQLRPDAIAWETVAVDWFFRNHTQIADWMGPDEKALAGRFQKLLDWLKNPCSEAQVFRIGQIKIDCYIIARSPDGFIALQTKAVET